MTDWQDLSECRGCDPDLFYPERGESWKVEAAKAICAQCPVTGECLEYALDNGERAGIWGGLSGKERNGMRRARPRPITHGTSAGYRAHLRRGEAACDPCLVAARAQRAESKARLAS